MTCNPLAGPAALAVMVTLANVVKPVLIDDTAYLAYARQVAAHPTDPYGFSIFWYTVPDTAMEVLCPPVLPYWLALGIRIVGDSPTALKLWLFPLVWLFAWAVRDLLRRFARGTESAALPLIVLSPAVLPTVNLMLDVPALALGIAALVLFIRGCDRDDWRLAAVAGVVAALAMQTKYTMLLVPPLLGWYGFTRRRIGLAVLAMVVGVAAFAGWEWLLVRKYGQSHFLLHAQGQHEGESLARTLALKVGLIPPLLGHLGCLAVGVGLYAARAAGFPRWVVVGAAAYWAVGFVLVAMLPGHLAVLVPGDEHGRGRITLPAAVWRVSGAAALITATGCAVVLMLRWRPRIGVRRSPATWFVVGWVLIELAGYFALTPFPAARRVIGLTVAIGVLAARAVSRVSRARPDRRPSRWIVPFGITAGILVAGLDTLDAYPEKWIAERATAVIHDRDPAATTWYVGHWGFQHYCERAGMKPAIPGRSALQPGDYLVLPHYPDAAGFYRPYPGLVLITPPASVAERIAEFTWDDVLSAQTVPNFYGGVEPIVGRNHPRLRVAVYRFTEQWVAGPK